MRRLRTGEVLPLGGGERGARAFKRWGEPEEDAGNQRNGGDVDKDFEVGVDIENERALVSGKGVGGQGHRRS